MGLLTYKILEGTAKNVQHSFTTHRGTSKNITLLQLGKKSVRLILNKPISIQEGDHILVAGRGSLDGTFRSFAYRNFDKGITAKASIIVLPALKLFYISIILVFLCTLLLKGHWMISQMIYNAIPYVGIFLAFLLLRQFLTLFKLRFKKVPISTIVSSGDK